MKKGVIFDLDGTLVNSMRVWENADFVLAERYGFVPDEEYWSKVTSLSFLEGAAYITDRYNLNKTAAEIADELYETALHDYKYNIELKPGAENLLKMLNDDGLKVAIATSNVEEMTHAVLKRNGVFEYINAFAYCELIESATIPATIKEIDEYAFFNCSGMKELNIYKAEEDIKLGKNWYPTYNGQQIEDCVINWK